MYIQNKIVEIGFKDKEQKELCTNQSQLKKKDKKKYSNPNLMKRLAQRLADLAAAEVLGDMYKLPGKFEELEKDRAGQFSLRLDEEFRLILEPTTAPIPKDEDGKVNLELARNNIPRKPDGGIDLKQVTAVIIIEAVSPHYE